MKVTSPVLQKDRNNELKNRRSGKERMKSQQIGKAVFEKPL